jgi:hypothetical protein
LRKVFEFPANNPYTPPANDYAPSEDDTATATSRSVH